MRVYCRLLCQAICIFLLYANANGQSLRPFLGEPDAAAPDKVTPRHSIRYNARGYDRPRLKKIDKTSNWLTRRGLESIISEFKDYSNQMGVESQIPAWIDSAWDEIKSKWVDCGGQYASLAMRFNPRSLYVVVEPGPFWLPQWSFYAAGSTDGRTIRALNVWADAEIGSTWVRKFDELVRWEMGNALMLSGGKLWNGKIEGEIGHRSPCGK
ncbi:MAG: hypothetical protein ACLGJB_21670 [Blastocatellia bacterium]